MALTDLKPQDIDSRNFHFDCRARAVLVCALHSKHEDTDMAVETKPTPVSALAAPN